MPRSCWQTAVTAVPALPQRRVASVCASPLTWTKVHYPDLKARARACQRSLLVKRCGGCSGCTCGTPHMHGNAGCWPLHRPLATSATLSPFTLCTVLGRFVFALNKYCKEEYGMDLAVTDYWVYEFAKARRLLWHHHHDHHHHLACRAS